MTTPPGDDRHPLAIAMEWVAKITTVVGEMVLPGIAGEWLDRRWGTGFIGPAGFALGLAIGIWHLIVMSQGRPQRSTEAGSGPKSLSGGRTGTDSVPPDREEKP